MDLDVYGLNHIESFLSNYEIWVKDLAKVAAEWPNLDEEERSHYRAEFMQVWGNRKVLGSLFKAHRLSPAQEARLAELDRLLLEQTPLMAQCFELDLPQLLVIFRWGSPLSRSVQTIRIEVEPAALEQMAVAFTSP